MKFFMEGEYKRRRVPTRIMEGGCGSDSSGREWTVSLSEASGIPGQVEYILTENSGIPPPNPDQLLQREILTQE